MCSSSVTGCGVASKPAGAFGRRLCSRYHPPMPTIIGKSMGNALGEKSIGRKNATMKTTTREMPKLFYEVDLPSEFLGRSLFSPQASSMGEVVLEYRGMIIQAKRYRAMEPPQQKAVTTKMVRTKMGSIW